MNEAPPVFERPDGYVQDPASQWVADLVGASRGDRVLDLCAAPGGKATALAASGAQVVANDLREHRARLVADNARNLGAELAVVVADGLSAPFVAAGFDRVLVDAPCSGLGVLRRRPDARWRVTPDDVTELAALQARLVSAAAELVRPGGVLVYSVCTLTDAETVDLGLLSDWVALPPPAEPWEPHGRGARLLPQSRDTDGMYVEQLVRPAVSC